MNLKKIKPLKKACLILTMSILSQVCLAQSSQKSEGYCLLQDEEDVNLDPAWNKKIATLLLKFDDEYLGYHAIYKERMISKNPNNSATVARITRVDVARKRKKDSLCILKQWLIIEEYTGSGYENPRIDGSYITDYEDVYTTETPPSVAKKLIATYKPCDCIEKTTNWLGNGTGSNSSLLDTTATNNDKVIPPNNKDEGDFKSNTSGVSSTASFNASININKVVPLDKKKAGYYEEKNASGIVTYCGYKINGKLDGEYRAYSDEGKLTYIYHYQNGNKEGGMAEYNSKGDLKKEGRYKNNKKDGTWNYYSEGKLTKTEVYINGTLQN